LEQQVGHPAQGLVEFVDMAEWPEAEPVPGILILKISGSLNFATIGRIQTLYVLPFACQPQPLLIVCSLT
jgi:hypothetical protein